MASSAAVSGARSILPSTPLSPTSVPSSLPPSREGDSPVPPDLLDQIPDGVDIGTVTADGAYGIRRCHSAIIECGGTSIIPVRRNRRPWKEDCLAARARKPARHAQLRPRVLETVDGILRPQSCR